MKTFMLTYSSNNDVKHLFQPARHEAEAMAKFREQLGKKKLPNKSTITCLSVDGHEIRQVEMPKKYEGIGKYFRWSTDKVRDLLSFYAHSKSLFVDEGELEEYLNKYMEDFTSK